jgi:hypothetical protein
MGAPPSAPRATAAALRDVARVAGAGPGRSPGAGRGMHARPHCLPRARWHCTAAAPAVSDVQDSAGRGKRRGPPPGRRAACALSECTPTCSSARAARAFVCMRARLVNIQRSFLASWFSFNQCAGPRCTDQIPTRVLVPALESPAAQVSCASSPPALVSPEGGLI